MIAIGVRRALPVGVSVTSPSARGPFEACARRPYGTIVPCAVSQDVALHARPRSVTATTTLRYNDERRGEENSMQVNDKAPDFSTTDENGKEVALKDFRGKTLVLFFYPK